ncbi:CRAL/TRIO domain-containing protein [Phanerochaete sordida]|uniref:CRAL/TRIO domain-containing protein n=1 Tax=Phanerochaete sordida TaxID=48140 RepID=A0A9P3LFJ3_9APHY|nr:CRAL/TRIO domain-containing protein [Phanerochaete sordida]
MYVTSLLLSLPATTTGLVLMGDLKASQLHTEALCQEPQNALTRRFTQAERDALKNLRPMLPEIRSTAYGGDTPKTISLWGVTIDPQDPAANPRASVVLMKFLRARKLDVGAAKTLLIEVLRWRKQVDIDDIMTRQFPGTKMPTTKFGKDREGQPVIYNLINQESTKSICAELEADSKMVIERTARNLEQLARSLDYETTDRVTRVTDMTLMSLEDLGGSKLAQNATYVRVVRDYYPDFSTSWFAVNAPMLLSVQSWVASLFVAPGGGKVQFVGKGAKTIVQKLSEVIDPAELPEQFGGRATGFYWKLEGSTPGTDAVVEKISDL